MRFFSRAVVVALIACAGLLYPLAHSAESKPAAEQKKDQKLPSAPEILERYAKAIGGKEAFKKHQSQHAKGTVEMRAQGIKGTQEVFAARPNKLLMKINMPGLGILETGYNGKIGWVSSPLTGPMLLEGKLLEPVATQADFDHSLHDPADYTRMEVLEVEEFNEEECYKVRLVHKTGFDSTEFFSVKSGLQRGFITTQESPLGPVTATTVVSEYNQFGDLYMPSRVVQKVAGIETVMTISEMEYDNVPASVFEPPADVQALAKKDSAESGKTAPARPESK